MKAAYLLPLVAFLHGVVSAPVGTQELHEKAAQGLRLLQLGANEDPVWKTAEEKLDLMRQRTKFFDVTETYELDQKLASTSVKAPKVDYPSPSHQSDVEPLLAKLSTSAQQADLGKLTAFNNRYYEGQDGADAAAWIQDTLRGIATDAGRDDIEVSAVKHSFAQSSTIAKFAGSNADGEITILSAHMDSINQNDPESGRAPGADDDGSGTVNIMDAFRVLATSGFKPTTPLEFHFYAGEEGGLLGSAAIAADYKSAGKAVKGVMQLDMTAYTKPGGKEIIALINDNVDSTLNAFITEVAGAYSKLPVEETECGYACSDHASWTKNGYPSAFPFEVGFGDDNPNIHSDADTTDVEGFSWEHSLEFAKLAVGFAVELSA